MAPLFPWIRQMGVFLYGMIILRKHNMSKPTLLKISLLSISLFLMSHLAIAPAIPKLFQYYRTQNPDLSLASVESLVTIPAMTITIVVVLSNLIVTKLGQKRTVQLGLVLILGSAILSFSVNRFGLVLLARLLLGAGIGLYNSLSISMISTYFEGSKRASMIGWRTATLNIGKTLTTFLVGYALLIGPRYIYLVYLLALPVLYLFSAYVPDRKQTVKNLSQTILMTKQVFLWMVITFFIGIAYIGATVKVPTLLVSHLGYSDLFASQMLTVMAFSGVLMGLAFGQLHKRLQTHTLSVMLLAMTLGNLCFALGHHLISYYVGAFLIGASFVGGMSAIFESIAKSFDLSQHTFVTSMAITAGNIGVIVTPLLLTKVIQGLGLETFQTPFMVTSALSLLALGVYHLLKPSLLES